MNLQQTIKDQRERITQQIREKFWNKGEKYIQVETADVEVFLDQITQQTAEAVIESVRERVREAPAFEKDELINRYDLLTRLQPNQE